MHARQTKIGINFIAPAVTTRFSNHKQTNAFISTLAIGYMSYKDKIDDGYQQIKGSTLGMAFDLGYDFKISEKTALGFQVSLLSGNLTEVTYNIGNRSQKIKLNNGEEEGLGRVDFSIGLRF